NDHRGAAAAPHFSIRLQCDRRSRRRCRGLPHGAAAPGDPPGALARHGQHDGGSRRLQVRRSGTWPGAVRAGPRDHPRRTAPGLPHGSVEQETGVGRGRGAQMMRMDGKVALVTGATKGIGLAIAEDLAKAGATVLMNYRRDEARAKEALAQVSGHQPQAALVHGDITDSGDINRMFGEIRSDYGRLDAMVNNAGITADGYALMMGDAKW